jgi:hypothetical protein
MCAGGFSSAVAGRRSGARTSSSAWDGVSVVVAGFGALGGWNAHDGRRSATEARP